MAAHAVKVRKLELLTALPDDGGAGYRAPRTRRGDEQVQTRRGVSRVEESHPVALLGIVRGDTRAERERERERRKNRRGDVNDAGGRKNGYEVSSWGTSPGKVY